MDLRNISTVIIDEGNITGVFSDEHLNPGDTFRCAFFHHVLISDGDLLNIIPLGMKAWREPAGRFTIESIMASVGKRPFIVIVGNHEGRESWVKELFQDYPNVFVCKEYEFIVNDLLYRVKHGHQFAPDWNIISKYADDVVLFCTGWSPLLMKGWYWFCRKMGWIPSKFVATEKSLVRKIVTWKNPKDYVELVPIVWSQALREAHSTGRPTRVVIGHTHSPIEIGPSEFGCSVLDLGSRMITEVEQEQ